MMLSNWTGIMYASHGDIRMRFKKRPEKANYTMHSLWLVCASCIDVQHNGKKLANSEGKAQDQKWLNDNGFISGQDI